MFDKLKSFVHFLVDSYNDVVDNPYPDWEMYESPSKFCWQLLTSDAVVPLRSTEGSAGFDLQSIAEMTIPAKHRNWVPTGVALELPYGFVGFVWPRSGLAGKGIDTSAGVIDSDYRGEIKVLLVNNSDSDFTINKGNRIAQLIIVETLSPNINFTVVDCLNATERGKNGFGSTGK